MHMHNSIIMPSLAASGQPSPHLDKPSVLASWYTMEIPNHEIGSPSAYEESR